MTAHPPRHGQLNGYPRDTDGWPLCRYCGTRCPSKRHTFCSATCVSEWKIRSDPSHARLVVGHRDKGVCAQCGTDTTELMDGLRRLNDALRKLGQTPAERAAATHAHDEEARRLRALGFNCRPSWREFPQPGQFWQMDHIRPVEHGGGMAGLNNLQTLCTPCHKRKTAEQARQRRKA